MPTGARISFGVYDESAKEDASYSASSAQSWVNYSEIKDDLSPEENPSEFERYISGEPGVYRLDGSSRLFPDSTAGAHLGYWSGVLSGSGGTFATAPVLTCAFSSPHTSVGITIHFDATTHLTAFVVQWMSGSNILDTVSVTGNNQQTVYVDNPVEDYTGLRIIPTSTDVPYRYVKIQEIDFGRKVVYDNSTLVSASVIEEADLSGGSAPANSLRVTVLDPGNQLNPVNPDGVYAYLRKGMPLTVEFLKDGTAYPGGVYYLDTWEGSNTGTAKLTALDCLGLEKDYESRFYSSSAPLAVLADVCASIGAGAEAGTLPVQALKGYIPRVTVQEAIAHICLASGGYARVTREGNVWIGSITSTPIVLQTGDVLGEPTVSKLENPDTYEIETNDYTVTGSGEMMGTNFIVRSGYPTTATMSNTVYYTNTSTGKATLLADVIPENLQNVYTAKGYADRLEVTRPNKSGSCSYPYKPVTVADPVMIIDGGTSANKIRIDGIPLIIKENYQITLNALKSYYARTLKVKFRAAWKPGLDLGACVTAPTRFGSVTGNISRMDIDLTGGLIATVEVIA